MKKSTKIVSMVIAVTLVMAIMTFVIYAATAGKVGINASVSWTAQAGVDLEFWGKVTGGSENKEIAKTYINPTTTNATAKIVDDLSCNFSDNTDDGVNNPNAIVFRYYVRNKSLTPLKIQVTKHPTQAEEAGTSEADHTPKVELSSQVGEENIFDSAIGAGYELKAGDIFEYSVTLSLASGGTGTINADTGITTAFDAGVTFNFTVGGNSNGTIITSVDGATPTSVSSSTLAGQTLGEYLATQQTAEYSTGWFFDEGLTKVVSDDYLTQDLKDSSLSSFYNKTASITGLVFTLSDDGNSYLVSGESSTSPSGEVVIPNMYEGKPVNGFVAGTSSSPTFKKNGNITSVILPNTITKVAAYTFTQCQNIINVTIPDSVTSIGEFAFYFCVNLKKIVLPFSVINLDWAPFAGCREVISIIVEGGNTKFDSRENCNALIETDSNKIVQGCKNTIITNTITEIGINAFIGCTGITSITISKSVLIIGSGAFSGCRNITSIFIPSNVISVGETAFDISSVTSIVVERGNKKYDSRNNCNAIIETESNKLILGCRNTIICDSVTEIGSHIFFNCSKLVKIFIPKSVVTISGASYNKSPFYYTSSTLKIYCEASEKPSGWGTYWNYYASGKTLNVTWGITRAQFDAL